MPLDDVGEQRDQFRIAPAPAHFLQHDGNGALMRKGRFVGTGGGQCVVDIGHLQNPRKQRNVFARHPIRITAAVPALVVAANDR